MNDGIMIILIILLILFYMAIISCDIGYEEVKPKKKKEAKR